MKLLSETKALAKLNAIREAFRAQVRSQYEHQAKSCSKCETPGLCCLDEHFVNVRVTRLESEAINRTIGELPTPLQRKVRDRADVAIEKFGLDRDDEFGSKTYSCPLFAIGIGCLVHDRAKPLPCIAHACYDRKEDLPPDDMLDQREIEIIKLNERTYGNYLGSVPIPIAITSGRVSERSLGKRQGPSVTTN